MQLSLSDLITLIPVLFISMAIHETAHAYVGYKLGDDTAYKQGRISLNPLRHIDPYMTLLLPAITLIFFHVPFLAAKPVPFNPHRVKYDEFGAALLGVAGPLSNAGLAIVGALLMRFLNLPTVFFNIITIFVTINVALFVFNMIPFPPLDGSRLLYAFAPEPLQRLMYRIEMMGFLPILALFILLLPVLGPLLIYINAHILHFLLGPMYAL